YGECDARHRPDRHDREGPGQAGAVSVPARFAIRSQARSNDGRGRYAGARRVDTGPHDRGSGVVGARIEDARKCLEDFRDGAESGIARHPGVPEMQGRPASQRQAGRPGLQRLQTRVSGARRHSDHADRGSQADRVTARRRAASLRCAMNTIDSPRARWFAWLAIGIYIVGLGVSATLRTQGDFSVYYRAGHRALHGLAIYPPADSDRFLYAPIFAIGFAPLAALPRHVAQFVFFAVNAFSLIELIIGAGVILFGRERRLPAALIVVPVLLSFRFIDNNIEHGQINLPTLALIVWAIIYADESRDAWAGLMLAAAILIKPFGLLAALHLAIRRHFAALGWTVAAGIALLVVPIVVFGPHGW